MESNGSLPPDGCLIVICGLTACTPGSAPGPMLGNKYGKPLTLPSPVPSYFHELFQFYFCYKLVMCAVV